MALPDPGSPFPPISLLTDTGKPFISPNGESLYAFFKTTCPTCELTWPYLERIRRLGIGGKLSVIAVSQDDPETTLRFNEQLQVALETGYDPEPWRASDALGLESVPTLFHVREDGTIRDSMVGFQRLKMEEFAERAADLAGKPYPGLFRPDEKIPPIKPG